MDVDAAPKARWSTSKSRSRSKSPQKSRSKSPPKPIPEINCKPIKNSKSKRKLSKSPPNGKENRDAALFDMLKNLSSNVESLAVKVGKLEGEKSDSRSSSRSRERSRGRSRIRSWKKSRSKRSRSSTRSRGSPVSRKSRRSEQSSSSERRDKSNERRKRSCSKNGIKHTSKSRSRSGSKSRSRSRSNYRSSRRSYSRSRSRSRSRSSSLEGRYRKRSYADERSKNKSQDGEPKERKYLLEPDGRVRTREINETSSTQTDFNEKPTAAAVDNDLAELMKSGFTSLLPDSKLTKYTGELKLPENCASVTTPNLNRELFAGHIKLGKFSPRNDARLANIQRLMLKAAVAMLQSSCRLRKENNGGSPKANADSVPNDGDIRSVVNCNGSTNNETVNTIIDLNTTAIELIGHAHQELSVRRRELLHTYVPEELCSMCFEKVDPSSKLFGDNIDTMMKNASKKYWTNSFKRGGFQVRRFQPFTRGRTSRSFQKRITYARDRPPFEAGSNK